MKKLFAALLVTTFAAGAFAQGTTTAPADAAPAAAPAKAKAKPKHAQKHAHKTAAKPAKAASAG